MPDAHEPDEMSKKLTGLIAGQTLTLAMYVGLAIASTWPLAINLHERLALGTEDARTVPYFNLWTIGWNAQCLREGSLLYSQAYWDAGIFFPARNAFAMSEAQPATALLAPLWFGFDSAAVAYNVYLIVSLALNGWVTSYCLQRIGFHQLVALGAGVSMLLLPIVHWQAGVLQLVPVWGIVWALFAVSGLVNARPRAAAAEAAGGGGGNAGHADDCAVGNNAAVKFGSTILASSLSLGLAFTAAFWMSVHHGLMLVLLAGLAGFPFALTLLVRRASAIEAIAQVALATLLLGVTVAPLLWQHHRVSREYGFVREPELVQELSAEPGDYLATFGRTYGSMLWKSGRAWYLSPGWPMLACASLTLAAGLLVRNRFRRWVLFWSLIAVGGFALSLGTNLRWGDWNVWNWLANAVPGLAQIRSVYRFAYFMQIASVLLAATGFEWFRQRWIVPLVATTPEVGDRRSLSQWRSWARWRRGWALTLSLSALVLGGWIALDPWPSAMRLAVLPDAVDDDASWFRQLSSAELGGVLVLPIRSGGTVHDYAETTAWMVQSLKHGQPLVNGYSGFFPDENTQLAFRCEQEGMTAALQADLLAVGVRYVLVYPHYVRRAGDDWNRMTLLSEPGEPVQLFEL